MKNSASSPIDWTPLTVTADKDTNERTDKKTRLCLPVRSFVRLLDGVLYKPTCASYAAGTIVEWVRREHTLCSWA